MNTEHFKTLLLNKERELQSTLASLQAEGRVSGENEVRDEMDEATRSQSSAESLDEAEVISQMLEQVQDALGRIADGSYGKCAVCGRQIEPARLEAIPWTPYCLEHQGS